VLRRFLDRCGHVAGDVVLFRRRGEDIDGTEARMIIQEALLQLDDDERRLMWLRFFEHRSQSEIADEIGTSQMQVSGLLSRLMVKIRMTIA
jgi:RNA polymerase sigma-B factor